MIGSKIKIPVPSESEFDIKLLVHLEFGKIFPKTMKVVSFET